MSTKTIETYNDLAAALISVGEAVLSGDLKPSAAKEVSNSYGKAINAGVLMLKHAQVAGVKPNIRLMNDQV